MNILIDGDSQSILRSGVTEAQTWPAILAARKGVSYTNFATSGATSTTVLSRVAAGIALGVRDTYIMCGINDYWYGANSAATYEANMITIGQAYQAAGNPVTFVTSFPFWSSPSLQAFPEYLRMLQIVAHGNNIPLIWAYTVKPSGASDSVDRCWYWPSNMDSWCYSMYAGDVYHPAPVSHQAIADAIP